MTASLPQQQQQPSQEKEQGDSKWHETELPTEQEIEHTLLSLAAEPSILVDYTPRHTTGARASTALPGSISTYRERRVQHYQQIAGTEKGHKNANYMDSPVVRRELGVNPAVADIDAQAKPLPATKTASGKREWQASDFEVGSNIGTGKFGSVYVARDQASRTVVALKILIKKELVDAAIVPFVKREIEIHAHLEHPYILRLYGYFQDKHHLYLVLDYASQGSLYDKLGQLGKLDEVLTARCISQVIDALTYVHSLGIIHRDIKPENILVDRNGTLKLADFGWSVHDRHGRRRTFCGTLDYIPPEMIEGRPYDHRVDIWALGVLAYELVVGVPPFEHDDFNDTYQHILAVQFTFPDHLSANARDFISLALKRLAFARASLETLQSHPWLKAVAAA